MAVKVLAEAAPHEVRFAELQRRMPGISQKMPSATLRSLTRGGLVARRVEPTVPPSVHYRLTEPGLGRGAHGRDRRGQRGRRLLIADRVLLGRVGLKQLYPPIEPYDSGLLDVGDGNEIYWETCGDPGGKPAVFLHGGPGGGLVPDFRRFFDPAAYRIVLFDQRNCGASRPSAADPRVSLAHNTTPHLVADLERLREHLSVERWLVFGGSWGSTLALAYAQAHPGRVTALVLRGIYLVRPRDEAWAFTPGGAAHLFPAEWEAFRDAIPAAERDDLVVAYGRRIGDPDPAVHLPAARSWMAWELSANTLRPAAPPALDDAALLAAARIGHHYIRNGGFLPSEGLLAGVDRIRHLPAVIVNGRYDMKTPPGQAWELHRAWPEAEFHLVEDAGHSGAEPGTLHHLVDATDRFRP